MRESDVRSSADRQCKLPWRSPFLHTGLTFPPLALYRIYNLVTEVYMDYLRLECTCADGIPISSRLVRSCHELIMILLHF